MDFHLYARVLWRFKLLIALGLVIALGLAVLSAASVSSSGLKYRQTELWSSTTQLQVTQTGFPQGRIEGPTNSTPDPNRLNDLAFLYAQYATIDAVHRLMLRGGAIHGKIQADPVVVGDVRVILPLIDLTAISTSPSAAIALAERGATALERYIRDQQQANEVPVRTRSLLEQVKEPSKPVIYKARSKTMPVLIFIVVMFAFVALAFVLENLRPTHSAEKDKSEGPLEARATQRRTA